MVLFAILMLAASISMIRGRKNVEQDELKGAQSPALIIAEGLVVGVLTGLVGAGGGFLIIPALIFLGKSDMKTAVAEVNPTIKREYAVASEGSTPNR